MTDERQTITDTVTETHGIPVPIPGAIAPDVSALITATDEPAADASPFKKSPETIPGYQITGELGRGGMGVVYRGIQLGLGRPVAIKTILGLDLTSSTTLPRFLAEAEVAASIRHPGIVQVYDLGRVDDVPFLVMEYLSGGSLAERLRAEGRLEPREAATLVMKIAEAVAAAHREEIVHRDLKPANILFSEDSSPKVTDFGIAKRAESELTATQAQLGTPSYMSPEQASGRAKFAGPAADVWSLGVILYECLSGSRPFPGESVVEVIRKVCDDDPQPLSRLCPTLDPDIISICNKCLRKDPESRYATAAELAQDLERYLRGEQFTGRREEHRYKLKQLFRRHYVRMLIGIVFLSVVLILWLSPPPSWWDDSSEGAKAADAVRRQEIELRVSALLKNPPNPQPRSFHPIHQVDQLPESYNQEFKILNDDRVIDLRDWKPITPSRSTDPDNSVVMQIRQSVFKDEPAERYRLRFTRLVDGLFLRAFLPHPEKAEIYESTVPSRGTLPAHKVGEITLDVTKIPDDGTFEVYVVGTFTKVESDLLKSWVALGQRALLTSVIVLFPPDQPYLRYNITVQKNEADKPVPYFGPGIVFGDKDKRWLYCEIPNPQGDRIFRLEWE